MTDSMKFGPEWLRNLSGDSCNSGGGGGGTTNLITPRYQLAEHRYGREEMLALFDRNCKPPEQLHGLPLFIEKTQLPLALIPMTEDETRLWNGGIATLTGGGRGRGGSIDRGGRGRTGRLLYSSYYARGMSYDDSGDSGNRIDSQSYQSRNRPFDRSQSERGWSERNGIPDSGEWNGSTSPRKELSRGTSGGSLMEGNWRRQRNNNVEDEDGWRMTSQNRGEKWVRGGWRDAGGSERARLERNDGEGDDIRCGTGARWDNRIGGHSRSSHDSSSHHHPARTSRTWEPNHHEIHDNLPEWATENPSESGGSFDASGAFHGGMYSDEDDEHNNNGVGLVQGHGQGRTRRVSEGSSAPGSVAKLHNKSGPGGYSVSQRNPVGPGSSGGPGIARERPKSLHPFEDKDPGVGDSPHAERRSVSPGKTSGSSGKPTTASSTSTSATTSSTRKIQNSASLPGKSTENTSTSPQSATLTSSSATSTPSSATPSIPVNIPGQRQKSFAETSGQRKTPGKSDHPDLPDPAILATGHERIHQQGHPGGGADLHHHRVHQQIPGRQLPAGIRVEEIMENSRLKPEDDFDRMREEADMLVAKLMADEESHKEEVAATGLPGNSNQQQQQQQQQEKWFYRDPQGEVQGPFVASEMAEWCKAGYFTAGLMVRRTCDERYATLGDLMKMCAGRVPFAPGPPIPPLKLTDQLPIPPVAVVGNPVAAGMPGSALPKPGMENPLLLLQYQQMRLLQNQQMLLRQLKASAIAKLSQSDHWSSLSPVEQNQLILQYVMQDSEARDMPHTFPPLLAPPPTNPVMQLFNQMQQAKSQAENHHPSNPHTGAPGHPDPIQQLIQQMGGIQNLPTAPQSPLNPSQLPVSQPPPDDNPIKSLLRQLNVNANGHPQTHPMESVWPQPPPQMNPQFATQNWLAQVGPVPTAAMPPGQMPNSLWDLHTKEMKTEQQILEEQNIRIQEDRKKEEIRKQEELHRAQAEGESAKRKLEEDQVRQQIEEAKRQQEEEEKKRKSEEKRRKLEEERRKQEEELKRKEEKKRREEDRKREEKRKLDEENNRKKQEEEKRRKEELKKQEKLRKEEEKRKKIEEEQKRLEEEKLKLEEETRQKAAAEEQARRAEQRRREAEALKKLQERSKAPWAQAPQAPSPTPHTSLAEIQRLEREKKAKTQRLQQIMNQQLEQRKAAEAAQESPAPDMLRLGSSLTLKWGQKSSPVSNPPLVKSLAQIQQEEQERIAKIKQQEKERQDKVSQKEAAVVLQHAGIWGTASHTLNWSNANSGSQAWTGSGGGQSTGSSGGAGASGGGFWDEPAPSKAASGPAKAQNVGPKNAQIASKPLANSAPSQPAAQQLPPEHYQPQPQQQQQQNNKVNKSKTKKDEEVVKKLFENNTAKTDDFTQWCNRTLSGLQASVDIPTFVGFLRDIESAYEVKEYVRMYLGDGKQCTEFAKQFLEKRSKWRSAQRPQAEADDLCKPAPAVNPNAPTEFQEVKGKSKKPKKGKMFKVDSRILGFSVTAATDRINVGDRDYGEGV